MAVRVIGVELHSMPLLLPEFNLQSVVIGISGRCQVHHRVSRLKRIRLEEVDRIPGALALVICQSHTGCKRGPDQIAEVIRAAYTSKSGGHGSDLPLIQPINELLGPIVGEESAVQGFSGEGRVEDGQRLLPRKTPVGKRIEPICLVNCQVGLSGLELPQETVFEDVDFVDVYSNPFLAPPVAYIANFEHVVPAQRPLDAEIPRMNARLGN